MFTLGGGEVIWRSIKQSCIADSTMEAEYVENKYHFLREIVHRGDMTITKIASAENLADPFTKALPHKSFDGHLENMGMRDMTHLL